MQKFQKKVLYLSLLWRKEINAFCVSLVVVIISDLAFCTEYNNYQKYCIFFNLFSPQKN